MKWLAEPFYRFFRYLMQNSPLWSKRAENRKLSRELEALSPAGERRSPEEFYAWRAACTAAVLVWGGGLLILAGIAGSLTGSGAERAAVARPDYGQEALETELEAWIEGESERVLVPFQVSGRKYTDAQAEELLESLLNGLEKEILGENVSLDEIRTDLVLPETLANGAVEAEWLIDPPDLVDYLGRISEDVPEEGKMARIQATLKCQEKEAVWSVYARILPPGRSPEEEQQVRLQEALLQADSEGMELEQMELPAVSEGKKIRWEEPQESFTGILAVLLLVCAAGVYLREEQELEKRMKSRRRQMIMDYPGLLYKMAMLLGAGLTIQGTFFRIGKEYRQRKEKMVAEKKKPEIHYAYEEILETCFEMQNGVGEAMAYENFGTRCQIEKYRKLGSLLAQNLRKGSGGLIAVLETEAAEGMEERKQQAKKMGEEAGTKLLLPMMMMLVLVMGILVIPAVMNL
ncbi:MAG: hypothetical protein SOZ59_15110 [Candidatus Limivivens sp.]|nr:hypothetical protein [Candidatus Limivivens sp.]